MSSSGRRPPPLYPPERGRNPHGNARERIAARRALRRAPLWQRLLLVLGGVLVLIAVGLVALLSRADRTLDAIYQEDPRYRESPGPALDGAPVATYPPIPTALHDPVNILLIGVDKRSDPEEGVRSDTLILVHLDPQERWASLLSIPRDSIVDIPSLGLAKINNAYAHGYRNAVDIYGVGTEPDAAGGAMAAKTIEQFLNIKVDYVAQVDFQGFERLIDTLGGVLVDVATPLLDAEYPTEDYGVERIYIPAGLQVLNGRMALIYARSRHGASDFDRSKRQQQVLRSVLAQVQSRGLLENAVLLPRWAEVLEQNIRTTLPVNDLGILNSLAMLARNLKSDRIVQLSINPQDVAIEREDGSDIYWNKQDLAALVMRWQAGPHAAAEIARVQVVNGAGVQGIAGRVTEYLKSKGFVVADPSTASMFYEHSLIIDYTDRPQARRRLADALGIEPRYVQTKPGPDAPPPGYQVDLVLVIGADYREEWMGD